MAKRPDIYDPLVAPHIPGLALSATQQVRENAFPLTAIFRRKKYTITENVEQTSTTINITEWGQRRAINVIEARMQYDEHHLPLQLDITLERGRPRGRQSTTQTYTREPQRDIAGTPPLQQQPTVELWEETETRIATHLLYVAARTLAEADPARRARMSKFDRDKTARGRYENQDFNELEEYSIG